MFKNRVKILFALMLCLPLFFGPISCYENVGNSQSNQGQLLQPSLENLRHDRHKKFIGHDGIKELCETHLGMTYLKAPKVEADILQNKSLDDLKDKKAFENDEKNYGNKIRNAVQADVYVKFIDNTLGYGLFANADIAKGEMVGEYTGVLALKENVTDTTWAWKYPVDNYKAELNMPAISLDAKYSGNAFRFSNHSDHPNTEVKFVFVDGLFRTIYIAIKDIKKDDQITISYGKDYWSTRNKTEI